jgi:hypothetical protein
MFHLFVFITAVAFSADCLVDEPDDRSTAKWTYRYEAKMLKDLKHRRAEWDEGLFSRGEFFPRSMLLSRKHGYLFYRKAEPIDFGIYFSCNQKRIVTISLPRIADLITCREYEDQIVDQIVTTWFVFNTKSQTLLIPDREIPRFLGYLADFSWWPHLHEFYLSRER